MITYGYECINCKDTFEIQQSIKDKPLVKCEKCQQESLRRIIYPPSTVIDKTPRTVGTLAEKNSRKHKGHINEMDAKKVEERKATEPWFGRLPKEKRKDLAKNPDKINKYIMEGK